MFSGGNLPIMEFHGVYWRQFANNGVSKCFLEAMSNN